MMELVNAPEFFATAREREGIRCRREFGAERQLWTDDPIFQTWRFCNVHRENDKTTVWFRNNIRDPLVQAGSFKIVEATVIFRWFNRIETGAKIKDLLLGEWDSNEAHRRLVDEHPVVTGAYIIKGPDGYSKLDGVLHCIDLARPTLARIVPSLGSSLQEAWMSLKNIYYLGPFMSYEVVSDLRWTPVLALAEDIDTWANAGPGAARGLGWVVGAPVPEHAFSPNSAFSQQQMLNLMQELLATSRNPDIWPRDWRKWEMREVEHWLCEYDKYKRAQSGLRLKRRY